MQIKKRAHAPFIRRTSLATSVVGTSLEDSSGHLPRSSRLQNSLSERIAQSISVTLDHSSRSTRTSQQEFLKRMLANAEALANQILEDARKESNQKMRIAQQAGYEDGLKQFQSLHEHFEQKFTELLEGHSPFFEKLIRTIATEVIGEAPKIQPEAILKRISRAMESFRPFYEVILKINEADYPMGELLLSQQVINFSTNNFTITLECDRSLPEGVAELWDQNTCLSIDMRAHLNRILHSISGSLEFYRNTQSAPPNAKVSSTVSPSLRSPVSTTQSLSTGDKNTLQQEDGRYAL